jgi:hypothetical protein
MGGSSITKASTRLCFHVAGVTVQCVRWWILSPAALACTLLAGCTVPVAGGAGIGRDAQGRLVGYLQVCHHRIDGATLYFDEQTSTGDANPRSVSVGEWTAVRPVRAFVKWPLAAPDSDWQSDMPLAALRPGKRYTLYGWTKDNSWSAGDVTFTPDEVSKLKPGQIMYWAGQAGSDRNAVTDDAAQFRRAVCKNAA